MCRKQLAVDSCFDPIGYVVLKGTFRAGQFPTLPRKVSVVVQFSVSVALILCTIVVIRQIEFAKSRPVGYDQELLITMAAHPGAGSNTYWHMNDNPNFIFAKINPAINANTALEKMAAVFHKYIPAAPFEYRFVDEEYQQKLGNEVKVSNLGTFFTILAVLISCMGLFGLAAFIAEQRTKEIGVRKVLGATVWSIWTLLTKEFLWLVTIALLIAIPIAWYAMHQWLQNYQIRTSITWWMVAATAAGALLITIITVSWQAIRAGLANPVKSLRTE